MGFLDLFRSTSAATPPRQTTGSMELIQACFSTNSAAIERLLMNGANPDSTMPDVFSGASRNALTLAVGNSDICSVQLLLQYGADPNSQNDIAGSALALACGHGCYEIVQMLLANSAEVNGIDADGWTPLMFAVSSLSLNPSIVLHLLQCGADRNAIATDGTTVLMAAARVGNPVVLRALIDHGCDVNGRDKDGDTALSIARKNGHREAERILLAARQF